MKPAVWNAGPSVSVAIEVDCIEECGRPNSHGSSLLRCIMRNREPTESTPDVFHQHELGKVYIHKKHIQFAIDDKLCTRMALGMLRVLFQ